MKTLSFAFALLLVACSAHATELISNGGFEGSWSLGEKLTVNGSTATISSVTDQTSYVELLADAALPTRTAWYRHPSNSRTGYLVNFTSGDLAGQKAFITSDVSTESSTATSLSYSPLGSLPSTGNQFEIYSAIPVGWDRSYAYFDSRKPWSKETANVHSGNSALRIDNWGYNTQVQETLDLIAGTEYTLSYFVASSNTTSLQVGAIIREMVNPADPATWTVYQNDRAFVSIASTYEERTLVFTPDHDMRVQLEMGYSIAAAVNNSYMLLDDISLTSVPEPVTLSLLGAGSILMVIRRKK